MGGGGGRGAGATRSDSEVLISPMFLFVEAFIEVNNNVPVLMSLVG